MSTEELESDEEKMAAVQELIQAVSDDLFEEPEYVEGSDSDDEMAAVGDDSG